MSEQILALIDEKINLAIELCDKLEKDFSEVDGSVKTHRMIDKELKFLKRLRTNYDENNVVRQLQCSNLNFYSHLINSLYAYNEHQQLTSISLMQRNNEDLSVRVDIVCEDLNDILWVKIIARKSDSINDVLNGRCEFSSGKDILEIADDYLELAKDSEMNFFRQPKVIFDFLNKIDESLEDTLEEKGIIIGRKFRAQTKNQQVSNWTLLNVDISSMLAYVSALSNGGTNYRFDEKLLEDQAAIERREPIVPILDKIFSSKKLISCETAVNSFNEIMELLGGENEKKRAQELLNRIEVYPDVECPEKIINVELSSQIKERSRKIFAFGIFHEAITVSSNCGFVRAAKMQRLFIPNIPHSARALTELKQRERID